MRMPIMASGETSTTVGPIISMLPAAPGLTVLVSAPDGTDTTGIPPGGGVVGWALIADQAAVGGARVDPVFLAAGKAWTPDQYRATYGQQLDVKVGRER
ncbi:hypothetical protein ACIHCX_03525 [Streptomyces sp. NPDC052043]|uniref:hypothetical protein n=1 Tax=Streptomyces sp. NPDC052043 TaxID=3365684 RepID=UPI0037D191D7